MDEKLNTELEALEKELIELKNKTHLNENDIRLQLNKVGRKCYELGKNQEALRYYSECLEIGKRILPSNDPSIANTLNNIGIVYKNQGKYEEALKYYNQSLEMKKQNLPSNQPSIANTLNNIGEVYKEQGKYEEALKYYNKSMEIYRQTFPSNHSSIADSLNNIGEVYKEQGKYEEALKYYNESMDIYRQTLPSNHHLIANILNNIGEVYYNQEKYEEALKYLNLSLEMKKQTLPSNHSWIGETLNNIGIVYYNQEKYEEALKYYNLSLKIYRQALPSNHFWIGKTLNNIGEVYYNQVKYEEALKYFNQSLEIKKQALPSNHFSIATTLNNIGLLYKDQGKYEIAINYLTDNNLSFNKIKDEKQKELCRKKMKEQDEADYKNKIQESVQRERELREMMEKMKLENELENKRLKEELERERQNKLNEQRIKEDKEKQNKKPQVSALLKTLPVREVKCDTIFSAWIISESKACSDELIEKVIDSKYKIDKHLGQGGFGKVFTVLDLDENITKVIKLIKVDDDEWKKEANLLSRLIHENIVKYHDHFEMITRESLRHTCIITEYCQNGDLSKRIKETRRRKEKFPDEFILNWIFQATKGLLYLHSMSVIHRDIKPANILLSGENVVKLADLGSAKVIKQSITNTFSRLGTVSYMSPEMLNYDEYSFPTDIWSLGCVLYELTFLEKAHRNKGKEHPSGGSKLFSDTIKRMLVEEPNNRIKTQNLYDDLEKLKHVLGI